MRAGPRHGRSPSLDRASSVCTICSSRPAAPGPLCRPEREVPMQPRGQLWFELAKVCQDFRDYSGLGEKEALELLVIVLGNMLAEQKAELEKRTAPPPP